jgi:shikimate kinase
VKTIALIGFMGAGKSAVGASVAASLHRDFLETDRMVEEKAGMTISEIFESKGEEAFRELESEAVRAAAAHDSAVIACGGGAVMLRPNLLALRRSGEIFYLRVSPEVAARRVGSGKGRPLLDGSNVEARLKELISERGPTYEEAADHEIDADLPLNEVAQEIIRIVGQH